MGVERARWAAPPSARARKSAVAAPPQHGQPALRSQLRQIIIIRRAIAPGLSRACLQAGSGPRSCSQIDDEGPRLRWWAVHQGPRRPEYNRSVEDTRRWRSRAAGSEAALISQTPPQSAGSVGGAAQTGGGRRAAAGAVSPRPCLHRPGVVRSWWQPRAGRRRLWGVVVASAPPAVRSAPHVRPPSSGIASRWAQSLSDRLAGGSRCLSGKADRISQPKPAGIQLA